MAVYENQAVKLSELFDNMAKFANAASNVQDDWLNKQAKVDTMRMQAQLESDTNDFMLQLQESNDYENWQTKVDDFLQEKKSKMSNKDSPYYCRNPLTASMYEGVMLNNRNSIQGKVEQLIVNSQQSENRVAMTKVFNDYEAAYKGQELIDKKIQYIDAVAATGSLGTPEQIEALKQQQYEKAAINETMTLYEDMAKANPNMKESELTAKVEAAVKEKLTDNQSYFSKMSDSEKVTKAAVQEAQRKIKQHQEEVNADYKKQNTDIREKIMLGQVSADKGYEMVMTQINKLNQTKPYDLTVDDQRTRIDELMSILDAQKKGDASGAGKAAAKSLLKTDPDAFIEAAIAGKAVKNENGAGFESMYVAREAWLESMKSYYQASYGENASQKYNEEYSKNIREFATKWQNKIRSEYPVVAQQFDKLKKLPDVIVNNKLFKELSKKDPQQAAIIAEQMEMYVWDMVANTDFSLLPGDGKIVGQWIQDYSDKLLAKELDSTHWYKPWVSEAEQKDENLKIAAENAASDMVFTDVYGATQVVGGHVNAEKLKAGEESQMQDLREVIGNGDVKPIGYAQTNNGTDKNSIQTYISDGVLYRYSTEDGKTVLKSSTDGKTWNKVDRKTYEEREKEAANARSASKKKAKEETNAAARKSFNQKKTVEEKAVALIGLNEPLNGAKQDEWDALPVDIKLEEARKYYQKNKKEAEAKIKNKYGN